MYSKRCWCSNWATLGVKFVLEGNNSIIIQTLSRCYLFSFSLRSSTSSLQRALHPHLHSTHSFLPSSPQSGRIHGACRQSIPSVLEISFFALRKGDMLKRNIRNWSFSCKFIATDVLSLKGTF